LQTDGVGPNVYCVTRVFRSSLAFVCLFGVFVSFAQAQDLPESILVEPKAGMPDLNTDALNPEPAEEAPSDSSGDFLPMLDVPVSSTPFTSRNFLGLGLSHSNAGVTRGLFKISEDEVLQGKVSESAWGMGLVVDMGWSEETVSSFRMKWGLSRVRVGLSDTLRSAYAADTLEEALSIVSLDFVLRDLFPSDDAGFWWGGGFGVRYAWSSSTPGAGSARVSKLRHSSALIPLLSLGSDVPLDHGHQLIIQGDWMLLNAYQLTVGLRTQL
jgi:hypothetical protein